MLDALVKLTEKIAELTKYRAERREQRFEKVIVPIYDGMVEVHQAYLSMFTECLRSVNSGVSLQEVAVALSRARVEDEAKRHALLNQVQGLSDVDALTDAGPFLQAIKRYFGDSPFARGNTPSYMLLETLTALEGQVVVAGPRTRGAPRESLERTIDMTLEHLRLSWANLSNSFAKLRAQSLQ